MIEGIQVILFIRPSLKTSVAKRTKRRPLMLCSTCGKPLPAEAAFCPTCGSLTPHQVSSSGVSPSDSTSVYTSYGDPSQNPDPYENPYPYATPAPATAPPPPPVRHRRPSARLIALLIVLVLLIITAGGVLYFK